MMSSSQRWLSSRLPGMDMIFHLRSSNHEEHRPRTGLTENKSLCLLLFLVLSLIACHRSKQKVIAVVPKGQGHIFWQTVHAGANAAGKKFGVNVLWNGPASEIEISKQINILEDFINRRVDGIVVAPSDEKALVPVIESATRHGIPVTIFDSG